MVHEWFRPARRLWTLQEFLAFDDGTDARYELFDGQIVAMAPASDVHGALVARLGRWIGNALRPGCEVVAAAGIFLPEHADSWYQADLAVPCAGLTGQQFVAEPRLIVDVLSPSTAVTDRERKLPDYRTIPSLEDILVVSSSEPRIEHYRREPGGWKIHDLRGASILRLEAFGISVDLQELYASIWPPKERNPRSGLTMINLTDHDRSGSRSLFDAFINSAEYPLRRLTQTLGRHLHPAGR